MVLMVPPPSTVQNDAPVPVTAVSLVNTVHKLYDLIFEIPLPKTRTTKMTKTVAIAAEVWHMARELATSARAVLHRQHKAPQLDAISRQLEVITAHLHRCPQCTPYNSEAFLHLCPNRGHTASHPSWYYEPTPTLTSSSSSCEMLRHHTCPEIM